MIIITIITIMLVARYLLAVTLFIYHLAVSLTLLSWHYHGMDIIFHGIFGIFAAYFIAIFA